MFETETCRRCWQTFSAGMIHACPKADDQVSTAASSDPEATIEPVENAPEQPDSQAGDELYCSACAIRHMSNRHIYPELEVEMRDKLWDIFRNRQNDSGTFYHQLAADDVIGLFSVYAERLATKRTIEHLRGVQEELKNFDDSTAALFMLKWVDDRIATLTKGADHA